MGAVTIAHLSDLHIATMPGEMLFGRRAVDTFDAVLSALADSDVEALLLTGDLTDAGDAASVRHVAERARAVGKAVRWLAGNHDLPHVLEEVSPGWASPLELGAWTVLPVQSFVSGEWFGRVSDEEYSRLSEELSLAGTDHVALAVHQPAVGICNAPGCVLEGAEDFLEFLSKHPEVKAVISGHQHRAFVHAFGGVMLIGGGSTCVQMDHVGDGFEKRPDPPMANLIRLFDEGQIEVVQVVAEYVDPA